MAFPIPIQASLLALSLLASNPGTPPAPVSASVEECVTAANQSERSATFIGQMTATSATQRMAIQIEIQERTPMDIAFHTVTAPGLGVWRQSETGVRIYKFVKQVTNLAAPAAFRAQVRYRWLDAHGHTIARAQRRTPVCQQPAQPVAPVQPTQPSQPIQPAQPPAAARMP
jgi:hypothetical protein